MAIAALLYYRRMLQVKVLDVFNTCRMLPPRISGLSVRYQRSLELLVLVSMLLSR